jgi:hypothetical protein
MGQKPNPPFLAVMSAFAGSGHSVHQANVRSAISGLMQRSDLLTLARNSRIH